MELEDLPPIEPPSADGGERKLLSSYMERYGVPGKIRGSTEDKKKRDLQSCQDVRGYYGSWYDADGPYYDCEWYGSSGSYCTSYGDSYANFGFTANQACCACGGETNLVDDTCYDDPDFTQLGPSNAITGFALNCEAFARPELEGICGRDGNRKDRNGLTANEG